MAPARLGRQREAARGHIERAPHHVTRTDRKTLARLRAALPRDHAVGAGRQHEIGLLGGRPGHLAPALGCVRIVLVDAEHHRLRGRAAVVAGYRHQQPRGVERNLDTSLASGGHDDGALGPHQPLLDANEIAAGGQQQ